MAEWVSFKPIFIKKHKYNYGIGNYVARVETLTNDKSLYDSSNVSGYIYSMNIDISSLNSELINSIEKVRLKFWPTGSTTGYSFTIKLYYESVADIDNTSKYTGGTATNNNMGLNSNASLNLNGDSYTVGSANNLSILKTALENGVGTFCVYINPADKSWWGMDWTKFEIQMYMDKPQVEQTSGDSTIETSEEIVSGGSSTIETTEEVISGGVSEITTTEFVHIGTMKTRNVCIPMKIALYTKENSTDKYTHFNRESVLEAEMGASWVGVSGYAGDKIILVPDIDYIKKIATNVDWSTAELVFRFNPELSSGDQSFNMGVTTQVDDNVTGNDYIPVSKIKTQGVTEQYMVKPNFDGIVPSGSDIYDCKPYWFKVNLGTTRAEDILNANKNGYDIGIALYGDNGYPLYIDGIYNNNNKPFILVEATVGTVETYSAITTVETIVNEVVNGSSTIETSEVIKKTSTIETSEVVVNNAAARITTTEIVVSKPAISGSASLDTTEFIKGTTTSTIETTEFIKGTPVNGTAKLFAYEIISNGIVIDKTQARVNKMVDHIEKILNAYGSDVVLAHVKYNTDRKVDEILEEIETKAIVTSPSPYGNETLFPYEFAPTYTGVIYQCYISASYYETLVSWGWANIIKDGTIAMGNAVYVKFKGLWHLAKIPLVNSVLNKDMYISIIIEYDPTEKAYPENP